MEDNTIIIYSKWSQHKIKQILNSDNLLSLPNSTDLESIFILNESEEFVDYTLQKYHKDDFRGERVTLNIEKGEEINNMIYIDDNMFYNIDAEKYIYFPNNEKVRYISWEGFYESSSPILSIDPNSLTISRRIHVNYIINDLFWNYSYTGIIKNNELSLCLKASIQNNTNEIINAGKIKLGINHESDNKDNLNLENVKYVNSSVKELTEGQTSIEISKYDLRAEEIYIANISSNSKFNTIQYVYRIYDTSELIDGKLNLYKKINDDLLFINSSYISNVNDNGKNNILDNNDSESTIDIQIYQSLLKVECNYVQEDHDKVKNKIDIKFHNELSKNIKLAIQYDDNDIENVKPVATRYMNKTYEWQFHVNSGEIIEASLEINYV